MSKVKASTQQLLDGFLASVPNLSSFEQIEQASRYLREQLDQDYSESTLGTILSKSGFYKRLRQFPLVEGQNAHQFTKQNGEVVLRHYCLNFLEPNWDERNQSTRISERLDNKKPINPSTYAEVVKKLLISSDYVELAIALIASTGRRPIEVVKTGNFKRIDGEDYQVAFTGQAKKRGVKTQFNISTFFPASSIIRALRRLRLMPESKKYKALTNDEIDNTINRKIRKLIPELFGDVIEVREGGSQVNNDILRSVSAKLLCTRDCPKSKDELKWVGEFLGHLQDDSSTLDDTQLNHLLTTLGYTAVCDSMSYSSSP